MIPFHTRYFSFVVILLIIGLAIFGIAFFDESTSPSSPTTDTNTAGAPTTSSTSPSNPKPTATLSYSQAVNTYSKSRIQFDANCQANPTSFTIKTGVKVMLDNRANSARTVTVDGTAYRLSAFGFRIISIPYSYLPYTAVLDCGTGKNSAKVTIVR